MMYQIFNDKSLNVLNRLNVYDVSNRKWGQSFSSFYKKMYQIFNDKSLNILKHSVKILNTFNNSLNVYLYIIIYNRLYNIL